MVFTGFRIGRRIAVAGCLMAASLVANAGDPIFYAYSTVIPSRSLGGFSSYGDVTPQVEKDGNGGIGEVLLPASNKASSSFVWWYAKHVIDKPNHWPAGERNRAKVTLTPKSEFQGDMAISLEVEGNWVDGQPLENVSLPAHAGSNVYVPMPADAAKVGKVRVALTSEKNVPEFQITNLSFGAMTSASIDVPEAEVWRNTNPVKVSGSAEGEDGQSVVIQAYDGAAAKVAEWSAHLDKERHFAFDVDRTTLPDGQVLHFKVRAPGQDDALGDYPFFAYPVIDPSKRLVRVRRKGSGLVLDGKPYAFLGVNYTPFQLGLSRNADFQLVARNFRELSDWGITAIRLTIGLATIQPAPGVFPDSPKYGETLKGANLDPRFFDLLRYAVKLGHHYGIRFVFDWHESWMDPYRYFLGGNPADAGSGEPGTPLAWLAMPKDKYPQEDHPLFISMAKPEHLEALFSTTSWMAEAFKGDGAILGFEVPYNEPHERQISNDRNWRWLVTQTATRVKNADPEALTFGMPAGWGHENVFISSTWLPPDALDGMTPHFYLSNGPIPVRPDADQRKYPYLAREVEPSLSLGLTALSLPYSAAGYPIYNGEGGGHGAESFLPDIPLNDATRIMIEAQIVQAYAGGMAGYFEWTMWNNDFWRKTTLPNKTLFQRYAPLFRSGPVDYAKSDILFVQNPAAIPNANGHNFAAVACATVALELHLQPVHYMTDDQLIFSGQTMFSRGFEQVHSLASGLGSYKAIIVDNRNIDERAMAIVRDSGIPFMEFGKDAPLEAKAVAEFLKKNSVPFDDKTSAEFQWVQGPEYLLVYRRSAGESARIFPFLKVDGDFKLIAEDGREAFSGNAAKLAADGFAVDLLKYTGTIYKIQR